MTEAMKEYLEQSVEYLGYLNGELRNLSGYATMFHELMQNADDAAKATQIIFDICDDALVVWNDGQFSSCGQVDEQECAWELKKKIGHLCDFHRFRRIASGDKRQQTESTGAFGVGFISVYQITDRPELKTGGRHWTIRPEKESHLRIHQQALSEDLPGTQFRLPWAEDAGSKVRKALTFPSVQRSALDEMRQVLIDAAPGAILFLRRVNRIEVRRNGETLVKVSRTASSGATKVRVTVEDAEANTTRTSQWYLLRGDFNAAADQIRERYPERVEEKRSANVVLAIPEPAYIATTKGLFHAFLPTKHQTRLPFHIHADFFPTKDRKRIIFERDYQGEWNRAAIEGSAQVLADYLEKLKQFLRPRDVWFLLEQLYQLQDRHDDSVAESSLNSFWEIVRPKLRTEPMIYSAGHKWLPVSDIYLLQDATKEKPVLGVLDKLNINVVDPDLAQHANLLRRVGVPFLTAEVLAETLRQNGFAERLLIPDAPAWFLNKKNHALLAAEIGILGNRLGASDHLAQCAIAETMDGYLSPPQSLFRVDAQTLSTFSPLDLDWIFASDRNPDEFLQMIPDFSVDSALDVLEQLGSVVLEGFWRKSPESFLQILTWFAARKANLEACLNGPSRLAELPLWPSGHGLHRLDELVVPGNFEDPLHIVTVLDARAVESCRVLLSSTLQAKKLTFERYCLEFVPKFFQPDSIKPEGYRRLIELLATNLGAIRDNVQILQKFQECRIVHCTDKKLRYPSKVYFGDKVVRQLLGNTAPIATPPSLEHGAAHVELLKWLGVAESPRPEDLVSQINALVVHPPDASSREHIVRIFEHIGPNWQEYENSSAIFEQLKALKWLPVQNQPDHWFSPVSVYAVFQEYLFHTQAHFLDIPLPHQRSSAQFLDFLGVRTSPETHQVVRHLIRAVQEGFEVNREVYRFLNDRYEDASISDLREWRCLLVRGVGYVEPRKAFWGDHPFGSYRYRLGDDFRVYTNLLNRLGVKDRPEASDAIATITEIATADESKNAPLKEEAYTVLMQCWRFLDGVLEGEQPEEAPRKLQETIQPLSTLNVIPDNRHMLNRPCYMFFSDRPRLEEKFDGFLDQSVIAKPLGAWRAMEIAGVRPLSHAVEHHLVECEMATDDIELQARFAQRRQLFMRVMEAQENPQWDQELFLSLHVVRAVRVSVQHTLYAFGRQVASPIENVLAFYDTKSHTLYFCEQGETHWSAMARELAYAVIPTGEAGQVAPGFKEVLRAATLEQAQNELDEMGFAPLQADDLDMPTAAEASVGGKVLEEQDGLDLATFRKNGQDPKEDDQSVPSNTPSSQEPSNNGHTKANGQQIDQNGNGSDSTSKSNHPKKKGGNKTASSGGQLRSYVVPTEKAGEPRGEQGNEQITETDRAGINRVLEYERQAGRVPKQMTHNHPGYDIESCDSAGTLVRLIEVKSTAGEWRSVGVGMTDEQFKKATSEKERFWLYVVERAGQSDSSLHCIQDPAGKVTQFLYDDGWQAVAEHQEQIVVGPPRRRSILDLKQPSELASSKE